MRVEEGVARPVQRRGRQFRLIEKIGAGAYGEVFLAEQDSGAGFVRKVALKLLHAQHSAGIDQGQRMRDEARILGHLQHRSIVAVLDLVSLGSGAGPPRWAVVMDYVPGADIEHLIAAANTLGVQVPLRATLELASELFSALDSAWNASDGAGGKLQVVHRDIKPSNVRLTPDGDLKVLDFGVARVNMAGRESETRGTGWIGTERYMAPERILCEGDGPAGDVYAAASTVLEVILGRPFGRTPVLPDRHGRFLELALTDARSRLPDIPADLAESVLQAFREALGAEPESRPDAAALRERFDLLSRQAPGDSLSKFSRNFVPGVAAVIGARVEAAVGVLTEGDGGSGNTFVPEADDPKPSRTPAGVARVTGAPAPRRVARDPTSAGDNRLRYLVIGASVLIPVLAAAAALFAFVGIASTGLVASFMQEQSTIEAPAPLSPVPIPATPVAAPVEPELEPIPAPVQKPVAPVSQPSEVAAPNAPIPVAAPGPAAATVSKAKVSVAEASSVTVRCGSVTANGTTSALIRSFPAGNCTVDALIGASTYTARVAITAETTVRCVLVAGNLKCS